jgi:hypothetical protein
MERLTRMVARAAAAASLAVLALALLACSDLGLKDYVEQKVLEYDLSLDPRPILVLKDGTTTIPASGTVTMPNTIFLDPEPKTLTIYNQGNLPLTLSSPTAVGEVSDPGNAYSQAQPVQFTVPAGGSVNFTVTFTPPAADADYSANLVINSDDPANGAYAFAASGHSTQWHGKAPVVASPSGVYQSPQIAIAGSYIYVTYMDNGIKLKTSTDGGKTWSAATTLYATSCWHSIAASGNNLHLFYYDSSGHTLQYCKSESNGASLNWVRSFPVDTNADGIMNSSIVLSGGMVYLCFYDTTNTKLEVAASTDTTPAGMSFGTPHDVTGGTTGQTGGFYPSLKVVSGTAHVTYADGKSVKFAKSSNLTSWTYKTLYTYATDNIGATALTVDSAGHALWSVGGTFALHNANSTDGLTMANWSSDVTLPENEQLSHSLPFVAQGGYLYASYYRYSSPSGIRMATSGDGGSSWSFQWLDQNVGSSGSYLSLAATGQQLYAIYVTPNNTAPNYNAVILMKSLDGGVTW